MNLLLFFIILLSAAWANMPNALSNLRAVLAICYLPSVRKC